MDKKELSCPVEVILRMVSGKWKIRILKLLASGEPVRYNQIIGEIPNLSAKVLAQKLRELEGDGLIQRRMYRKVPPQVEYSLTESGLGIVKAMMELRRWGNKLSCIDMSKCCECRTYSLYYDD